MAISLQSCRCATLMASLFRYGVQSPALVTFLKEIGLLPKKTVPVPFTSTNLLDVSHNKLSLRLLNTACKQLSSLHVCLGERVARNTPV